MDILKEISVLKEKTVVKITKGQYFQQTGVITEMFEAGDLDDEPVYTVEFTKTRSGQFKESELMEIAQGGEIL